MPHRLIALILLLCSLDAAAHDPIFGLGPHVLYKGGIEASWVSEREDGEAPWSQLLETAFGLTGDWSVNARLALYGGAESRLTLASKYRFWRRDRLGIQESSAVMLRANDQGGWGVGAAYGYESLRYYRWISLRRQQGPERRGQRPSPLWRLDLVGGWRPIPPRYTAPDTVWLLELNGEADETQGRRLFLSPGIFWTRRNFAIKAGVQYPLSQSGLPPVDYRFHSDIEWHF